MLRFPCERSGGRRSKPIVEITPEVSVGVAATAISRTIQIVERSSVRLIRRIVIKCRCCLADDIDGVASAGRLWAPLNEITARGEVETIRVCHVPIELPSGGFYLIIKTKIAIADNTMIRAV